MRRTTKLLVLALVFSSAAHAYAFEITGRVQSGVFCNSKDVAQELALILRSGGPDRLRMMVHIQFGRAQPLTGGGLVGFLTDANYCMVLATVTNETPQIDGGVATFATLPQTQIPFGQRLFIYVQTPPYQVVGSETVYEREAQETIPQAFAKRATQ